MRRIALGSLTHDRGKLVAAVAGIAFSSTLSICQLGIYQGLVETSSAVIRNARGDLWVMAKGTEVFDNVETLSAGTASIVAGHACVTRARGLVVAFAPVRKPSGTIDAVQVVGVEPRSDVLMPWSVERGLPTDLAEPMRVSVDKSDLTRLELGVSAVGSSLDIAGQRVEVAAVTTGVRSFTLSPYVFANLTTARALAGLGDGQVHYWVVDLASSACAREVSGAIERHPDLRVLAADEFRAMTESFWVWGSGAGIALAFGALLGLVVGCVIVGQTLYGVTKEHMRELATLKAIGASRGEALAFVAWQAAFLAAVGGAIGILASATIARFGADVGLSVVLTPGVFAAGAAVVVVMSFVAALFSARAVLRVNPLEVFK